MSLIQSDNKLIISTDDLHEGMVLAQEITDNRGVRILAPGTVMSEAIIQKLQITLDTDSVFIYKPDHTRGNLGNRMQSTAMNRPSSAEKRIEKLVDLASEQLKSKIFTADSEKLINVIHLNRITELIIETSLNTGELISYIMKIREHKDTLYKHSINVAALSCMLGKWLGYDNATLKILTRTAMLHDIGKTRIDSHILDKPSKLSAWEFNLVKKHSEIGYRMIKKINYMSESVSLGVLMHHEKEDGSGYPLGLSGYQIHPFAKIIAIADIFDALTSKRVYHKRTSPLNVLEIFQKESYEKLDVKCTLNFVRNISSFYEGAIVLLNTGERAKIVKMNPGDISRPLILVGSDFIDLQKSNTIHIDDILPK
ncbi:metal dependent phosphohydrolase [Peptoclostridium acidaminophilum DSM 3953]|uniref:Metal dependent phosphohydrolase n=1 Tax=Peptoclostridium acidaminophilum DSM 3953 TaxID=1286171 RepID=W8T1G0_PEPAC|nr:HD-GYP domain-containing protein [Peptoclostridium acidaminophilum]AHM55574.1 metal dependent phosphohydrolase [Peptoclostridium acidaminophilum DSM 3953]